MIEEKEHDHFERHGDDILYELYLSFSQVAIGDTVEVPTLKGKAKWTISPGTQSGKILRLRGKGIRHLNDHGKGDQLVRVVVWTPTKLNDDEKSIFKDLADHKNFQPPKEDKSFFNKVKEALFE